MGSQRPMFATITVAVCHCGAGCVLGDIVGEWIVWGTNARIAGELLYTEFIVGMYLAFVLLPPTTGILPAIHSLAGLTSQQTFSGQSPSASSSNTSALRPWPASGGLPSSGVPYRQISFPSVSSKSGSLVGWPLFKLASSSGGWR